MTNPVISEALVPWADLEELDLTKMGNISLFAQRSLDNAISNFFGTGIGYTGMACQPATASGSNVQGLLNIAPGYMARNGIGYSLRDAYTLDLSSYVNQIPDSTKTLVVYVVMDGQEGPITGNETFLDSTRQPADPNAYWPTTEIVAPLMIVRSAVASAVAGTADVQPADPTIPASLCPIARVVIGVGGIQEVDQIQTSQIQPTSALTIAVAALQAFQAYISPVVDGLKSTVSALALSVASQFGALRDENTKINTALQAILARLSAPQAVLKGADFFTDLTQSNPAAPNYAAAISQGLTFPPGAFADAALMPQNLNASNIATFQSQRYICPAYTEVVGAVSATFLSYNGPTPRLYFQNFSVWSAITFLRGFGVWRTRWAALLLPVAISQVIAAARAEQLFAVQPSDLVYDYVNWGSPIVATTELIRKTGYWRDLASRGFWTPIIGNGNAGGVPAIVQVYRPAGAQMITSVELGIEKVGTTGDVRLMLMGDSNGNPDPTQVLADVTVTAANLGAASTKFVMPYPILVKGGATVHKVILTTGAHRLRLVPSARVVPVFGGAILAFANGAWGVVQLGVEIAARINVAQFANGSVRIPLNQIGLTGGIDSIDAVAPSLIPDGCRIDYETVINSVVTPIGEVTSGAHPLAGRPSNLPLTLILSYTPSTAPIIDLSTAKVRMSRQATGLNHTSIPELPPVNVHTVNKSVIVNKWNPALHTLTAALLTGTGYGTSNPPTTVTDTVQADGSLLRQFAWAFTGAGIPGFEMNLVGTTTDPTQVFTITQTNFDAET